MVTKRYLDRKFVEPIRERLREEGREEARKQRREEAKKDGARREHERWVAWNQRRLDAEARGEPFDEPTPDQYDIDDGPEYY